MGRDEIVASAGGGAYSFGFGSANRGGIDRIRASTDHDNNGKICDEGEA